MKYIEKTKNSEENYSDYYNNDFKSNRTRSFLLSKKIKDEELSILCKQMAILLESGCEILQIMDILKLQSNNKIGEILNDVSDSIKSGESITESFNRTGKFSNFFISAMKSGEVSGKLDEVMHSLSVYYDKEYKTKKKVSSVTMYPKIVILVSIVAMIIIMNFVIPNFEMTFETNGIEPPPLTKILLSTSRLVREEPQLILALVLTITVGITYLVKKDTQIVRKITKIILKSPVIRDIYELTITTRFSKSLGMLIKSGVNIVESIEISSNIINNDDIKQKLIISNEYIKQGNSIYRSLLVSNIFPSLFISMIKTGEESGRLDESLQTAYSFYDNELDIKRDKAMRMIEPITLLVLGVFVGSFIIAMVTPIFDAMVSV